MRSGSQARSGGRYGNCRRCSGKALPRGLVNHANHRRTGADTLARGGSQQRTNGAAALSDDSNDHEIKRTGAPRAHALIHFQHICRLQANHVSRALGLSAALFKTRGTQVHGAFVSPACNQEIALQARGLSFAYREGDWILKDISLSVPSGQITIVMGPSGTGKTTLLKILAGILKPCRGHVEVLNHNIFNLEQRSIASLV